MNDSADVDPSLTVLHARKPWWKLAFLAAFVVALGYWAWAMKRHSALSPEHIVDQLRKMEPYSEWAYAAMCLFGTVIFLPDTAMDFAGAVLFGPYWGTALCWLSVTGGATLTFLLTRWMGRDFVERWAGARLLKVEAMIREQGFSGIFVLRLLPIVPFSLLSWASGLTSVRLRDYFLATFLATLPVTLAYQLLFSKFGLAFLEDPFHSSYWQDAEILVAIGAAHALVLGAYVLTLKLRRSRDSKGLEG